MYYDINNTLSYNALFNIVLGGRGIGKSYQWKIKAVRDFLKKVNSSDIFVDIKTSC